VVLYLRSLNGNYCGGLTGNKYENTKSNYPTTIRSRRPLRSQDFKMEPKNEKIHFWKRDSNTTLLNLTQTLELTNVALEKVYNTITNNGKILFVSTKNKHLKPLLKLQKKLINIL